MPVRCESGAFDVCVTSLRKDRRWVNLLEDASFTWLRVVTPEKVLRDVVGICRLRRACPPGQPAGASVLVRGRHAPDALGSVRCLSSRQPVFGAPFTHLTMRAECFSAPSCRIAKLNLGPWSSARTCAAARPDRRFFPHAHHSHFRSKPGYPSATQGNPTSPRVWYLCMSLLFAVHLRTSHLCDAEQGNCRAERASLQSFPSAAESAPQCGTCELRAFQLLSDVYGVKFCLRPPAVCSCLGRLCR